MLGYPEFTTRTTVPRTHKCDRPWFNLGSYRSFVLFVSPICWFLSCFQQRVRKTQRGVLCFDMLNDHDSQHHFLFVRPLSPQTQRRKRSDRVDPPRWHLLWLSSAATDGAVQFNLRIAARTSRV